MDAFQPQTTEIFCPSCPPVEAVQAALRSQHCFLQHTFRPGRCQAATYYHFEGAYGVSVMFLAGTDTGKNAIRQAPLRPTARIWISGNTHPRSLDIQQQLRAKLLALTGGTLVKAQSQPKGAYT